MNAANRFLTELPRSSPLEILRMRDGLYAVDVVGAAISGFDFFTWLGRNPSDTAGICEGLGIQERPTDVMLSLFASLGLIRRTEGRWELAETGAEFLNSESPWCLGPYYSSLKDRPVCLDLIQVLKTGRPANWGSYKNEKAWAEAMEQETFARQFTAAMDVRGRVLGPVLARLVRPGNRRKLLDVAGGSGVYAACFVAVNPGLEAVVFEKSPVDRIARVLLAERGVSDRVEVRVGDMFSDDFPGDCDIHLFSNVLHDWDVAKVRELLSKSFKALPPGGMLVVHDVHLNEAKDGPYEAAAYSALLMTITEGRCYSVGEMRTWMEAVGFADFGFCETVADRSFVSAIKPG